jgi:hypothetical protein
MQQRPDPTHRSTWRGLLQPYADQPASGPPPIHPFGGDDPAIAAWVWCLEGGEPSAFASLPGRRPHAEEPHPMLAPRDDLAIEVWTECELSVLHAGFRRLIDLTVGGGESTVPGVETLVRDLGHAVAWHLEHTQPDNATTHPWGLHAILELGRPTEEAIDHAASMLHAMQAAAVMTPDGRPDAISRWIVADLVETLDRLGGGPVGRSFGTNEAKDIEPHR